MSKFNSAPFYCPECKAKYELGRTELPQEEPIQKYGALVAALRSPDAKAHSSSNTSLCSAVTLSHGGHRR
jgi:hypothetical protein